MDGQTVLQIGNAIAAIFNGSGIFMLLKKGAAGEWCWGRELTACIAKAKEEVDKAEARAKHAEEREERMQALLLEALQMNEEQIEVVKRSRR